MVEGSAIGLQGLDEILMALRAAGHQSQEEGLGAQMVEQLSQRNYIPPTARELFARALEREYAAFLAQAVSGAPTRKRGLPTWRGYPREEIPWFPTVSEELCDGCGLCLKLCSTHALARTENGRVRVADPFACVIGCSSCAAICKPKAIIFPPKTILDAYKPILPR